MGPLGHVVAPLSGLLSSAFLPRELLSSTHVIPMEYFHIAYPPWLHLGDIRMLVHNFLYSLMGLGWVRAQTSS